MVICLDEQLKTEPVLECKDIIDILPHKHPFLLVDRVLELDLENDRVLAQKNVTVNEPFFQGLLLSAKYRRYDRHPA